MLLNNKECPDIILKYDIGEPATPPRIAPARGPPQWEEDEAGAVFLHEERVTGDLLAQSEPAYEFDQRVTW
jgi:hypothetical protein